VRVKLHCGEPPPSPGGLKRRGVAIPPDVRRHPAGRNSVPARHAARSRHVRGSVIARSPLAQRPPPVPAEESPAPPMQGAPPLALAAGRSRRWHEPRRERRQHWLALLFAALLHGVFVLVVWQQMRPRMIAPTTSAPAQEALQIRFISSAPARATPPAPALQAPPRPRVPAAPREPPRKNAMSLQLPAPPPPRSTARLFDQNGQPLLPAPASSTPVPDYVQHLPQGDPRIMQHRSPVTYQATRFDQDWGKSNAVDSALQKLVDKTTVKKTIRLPRGVRIHCAISLAMLAGGCGGDPPAKPSAKDGDVRLNMAPARSLDGQAHAPKPPDEQACIHMYRAGKPLAWGCAVDTPDRAVDAELRERAAKAARGH